MLTYRMKWIAGQNRWAKQVDGKRYYLTPARLRKLGYDCDNTKLGSRAAANAYWDAFEAELQASKRIVANDTGKLLKTAIWNSKFGKLEFGIDEEGRRYQKYDDGFYLHGADDLVRGYYLKETELRQAVKTTETIGHWLDQYFADKKKLAASGNRSSDTIATMVGLLKQIGIFCGRESPVSSINGVLIQRYNSHLHELVAKGECKPWSAHNRFSAFKSFVRWLYQLELIDLPRNLTSKHLGFDLTNSQSEPVALPIDTIKQFLAICEPRQKLVVLLGLNFGFTQKDTAEFNRLDIVDGHYDHKRAKTKKHAGVPKPKYLIWQETAKLLEVETLPTRRQIETMYDTLNRKRTGDKIAPKHFRSTAASLIYNSPYSQYAQYFLGHSPRTIADKHYIVPSQTEFDECLKWLRNQIFGE